MPVRTQGAGAGGVFQEKRFRDPWLDHASVNERHDNLAKQHSNEGFFVQWKGSEQGARDLGFFGQDRSQGRDEVHAVAWRQVDESPSVRQGLHVSD